MPRRRRARSFAPLVIAVTLAACTQPSPTVPSAPALVGTPVSGITISGLPSSVSVGQSFQLTANVVLPDGAQKLALDATWKSSDTTVATVSITGFLTATGPGNADVTSTFEGVRGLSHVLVSKSSPSLVTYDISGVVREGAPTENVVLAGATVGIHFPGCPTCPHDNQETTTDDTGHFTLPGIDIAGFSLVVSKPAYDTTAYYIAQLPRDQNPDISLIPVAGEVLVNVSGTNACTELPTLGFAFMNQRPGYWWGGRVAATFHVYHSGNLVVHEVVNPAWGVPQMDLLKLTPDGTFIDQTILASGNTVRQPSFSVESGYKYVVGFSGDLVFCAPFKAVLTRPK